MRCGPASPLPFAPRANPPPPRADYFRDSWNLLDFAIVAVGWIGLVPGVANFTVLRVLRVLRPLRSINKLKGMKVRVPPPARSPPVSHPNPKRTSSTPSS